MAQPFDPGDKLRRFEAGLSNPAKALAAIGRTMVAESRSAFKHQAFGDIDWPPRRVPNVFGLLADFEAGVKTPPKRRFDPTPALVDTGRLRGPGGITHRIVSIDTVEVGRAPDLRYADVLHFGGEVESVTITQDVQDALWGWLRRQGRQMKRTLGWLLNKKFRGQKLKAQVPERPFVGITRQTQQDIVEIIGGQIFEVGR